MDPDHFRKAAEEKCGLVSGRPIVTGVSGGADSFCLAETLVRHGFQVIIAHFDHRLRPTAARDAAIVEEYARSRELPFYLESEDILRFCRKNGYSLEEGARIARYRFLFSLARKLNAQAVAVGHNADDQAETVLMHFIRGAGTSGLRGMPFRTVLNEFDERIPLVRPLLDTPREDTERHCVEYRLTFVTDESNLDTSLFRNKLRLEVLPLLESLQPGMRSRLGNTALLMEEVNEFLEERVIFSWDQIMIMEGPGFFGFSLDPFLAETKAVQRGVIRKAVRGLRDHLRDVDFKSIDRVITLAGTHRSGKIVEILDGLEAEIRNSSLLIKEKMVEIISPDQLWMPPDEVISIPQPEGTHAGGNWKLEIAASANREEILTQINETPSQTAYIDSAALVFPLDVRTRRQGDRIQPFGMDGHSMKLADFWINAGLTRSARDHWPLVCSGDMICWIPGYRIMHPFRVTPQTQHVLEFRITRI